VWDSVAGFSSQIDTQFSSRHLRASRHEISPTALSQGSQIKIPFFEYFWEGGVLLLSCGPRDLAIERPKSKSLRKCLHTRFKNPENVWSCVVLTSGATKWIARPWPWQDTSFNKISKTWIKFKHDEVKSSAHGTSLLHDPPLLSF
jgi:hypothetical protein